MPPAALRDKLTALPDSVQTRLASFLSKRDVAALSRCNRTIFGYVGQQLWKHVEIGWDDIGSLVPGRLAGVSSIKFVHIKADDARPPPQGYLDLANAIINVLAKDQLLGLTQVSPPSAKRFTSSSPCSASRVASFRCQDFAQLYRSQARVEIVTIPNLWAFDPAVIQAPEKIKTLVIHHMPDDHESANALVRLLRAATNVERLHIHADLVDIDPTFAIGESWADLLRAKTITDRNFLPQVHTLAFEGVNFDREGRDAKRLFSLWKMRTLLFRDCGGLGALLPTHYEHGSSDVDAELESLRIIRGSNMPALYPLHDFLGRCPFLVEVTITWAEDIPLPCIRRLATPFLRRLYLFAPAHQGTFAAANADVWKQFVRKAPALKSLAFPFAEVAQCDLSVPPGGFWETRSDGLPFSFMKVLRGLRGLEIVQSTTFPSMSNALAVDEPARGVLLREKSAAVAREVFEVLPQVSSVGVGPHCWDDERGWIQPTQGIPVVFERGTVTDRRGVSSAFAIRRQQEAGVGSTWQP